MRRRTITQVVVGLVLALFVLPAAAEIALTDEEPEPEYPYASYGYYEDDHVVTYGIAVEPIDDEVLVDCSELEGITFIVEEDPATGDVTVTPSGDLPDGCSAVSIEGPNGQVNHGQFVSSMVHAYKEDYDKETNGPFGQFLKDIKHDKEIGKGDLQVKPDNGDDLEPLEAAELDDEGKDDGDGPPAHANGNSKKPKKNK